MDLREVEVSNINSGRHPWELARKDVVSNLIRKKLPEIYEKEAIILDIGCGDTWLIEQLSKEFTKAKFVAVDIAFSDKMLESYRNRLDKNKFEIYKTLDNALENKETKVDLILLLDVIEHIENDITFIQYVKSFKRNITSSTKFLITVPAFQNLFCKHDVFLGHYRRYDNKLLKANIEKAGLKPIDLGYFFTSLLAPRLLDVILEKTKLSKSEAKGIGDWKEKGSDKVIKNVLLLDYKFTKALRTIGLKIPGLSNYVICH